MDRYDDCPVGSPENCPVPTHDRRHDDGWRADITNRLTAVEGSMKAIERNTTEIVAFFEAGRGFFRVASWVGTAAKWITRVAAAVALLWFLLKTGLNTKTGGGGD